MATHVALVAETKAAATALRTSLNRFVDDRLAIMACGPRDTLPAACALVLAAGGPLAAAGEGTLTGGIPVLPAYRALPTAPLQAITALPTGSRVVVATPEPGATIALLQDLGFSHLRLEPRPQGRIFRSDRTAAERAVCAIIMGPSPWPDPEEPAPHHIINLGLITLDAITILDMLTRLNMIDDAMRHRLAVHARDTIPLRHGLRTALNLFTDLRDQLVTALNGSAAIVIVIDHAGRIQTLSAAAARLCGPAQPWQLVGTHLAEAFPILANLVEGETPAAPVQIQIAGRQWLTATQTTVSDSRLIRLVPPPAPAGSAEAAGVDTASLIHEYQFLLKTLSNETAGAGRARLASLAAEEGIRLTEQAVRLRLERLAAAGLVERRRGRAGTIITGRAIQLLAEAPLLHDTLSKLVLA